MDEIKRRVKGKTTIKKRWEGDCSKM
jgi:hypothetical protein